MKILQRGNLKGLNRIVRAFTVAGIACAVLMADEMPVMAAEGSSGMLQAGVGSVLNTSLTAEEYVSIAEQSKGASWGYTDIGVANVDSGNLNVRAFPSTDGKLVGKMPKNSVCEILEKQDGWAHIQSGEVEGYVSLDYLLTGPAFYEDNGGSQSYMGYADILFLPPPVVSRLEA